jgi:catechol 2,3-dioxygenase-like lactoylglutathione lyase family enzyme
MPQPIVGLHHVTAIASDAQRNLDFYTQALGSRFVKRTVKGPRRTIQNHASQIQTEPFL